MPAQLSRTFGRIDISVLAVIILIGLVNLPMPFHGDQALFSLGAKEMANGAVLYRDIWDLKQPGIFGFYLLAGKLFGFSEIGVHALELMYLAGFALVLAVTLKGYYDHSVLASLAPLFTVGVYYGVTGSWHLTQVEGLIGFPLFLCLWLASTPSLPGDSNARRLFLSGAAGGVVLLFKLMFLPMLIGFWLTGLVMSRRPGLPILATFSRAAVPIAAGVLCPLLPVLAYFAWEGVLPIVYKTFFEYPPRMLSELPPSGLGSLLGGFVWLARNLATLMALGLLGACLSLARRRDGVTLNLAVWCVLGFVTILLQRRSWWEYQYLLLIVPLGLLALRAVDLLWPHRKTGSPGLVRLPTVAWIACLLLLFAPVEASWVQKAAFLIHHRFALDKDQRLAYQGRFHHGYPAMTREVAFLADARSRPGPIFVCGNPVYYYLSGRQQAGKLNGWALELFLPEMWSELVMQLQGARPAYVFVDNAYRELISARSALAASLLDQNYRVLHEVKDGRWYELSDH